MASSSIDLDSIAQYSLDFGAQNSLDPSTIVDTIPDPSTFVILTSDQLKALDASTLQLYMAEVSSLIVTQQSTIIANDMVQANYDYLILISESTMSGLSYEILTNSNTIIDNDAYIAGIISNNAAIDSTIASYNSTITGATAIMDTANTTLSSLTIEYSTVVSNLSESDIEFIRAAEAYSSLYYTFMAEDAIYQTNVANQYATSSILSNAIIYSNASFLNLQESTLALDIEESNLASLYIASNALYETYETYKTIERKAWKDVTSTQLGITGN